MEFLGFMVILLVGGLAIKTVFEGLQNPDVINALSAYSPLLSEYSGAIAWVSAGVLTVVVLLIPIKLKTKEIEGGENGMEIIGIGAIGALQGLAMVLGIMAVTYLAGVGWVVATHGS